MRRLATASTSRAFDARDQGLRQRGIAHEDPPMKMPKSTTQINAARPERVHAGRDA